jgi:hypothetical protein
MRRSFAQAGQGWTLKASTGLLACVVAVTVVSGAPQSVQAQSQAILNDLDRGHRLLLEHGFQIHGAAWLGSRATHPYPNDPVDLAVLKAANFTGINFGSANWTDVMWTNPAGNYNWSRWSASPNVAPYTPYDATGMVMASSRDERILYDPVVLDEYTDFLTQMRAQMPNVISHVTDNGKDSGNLSHIRNFMTVAQPDMLFWDHYVFGGTNSTPNPWTGGSPTRMYDIMGKYRAAARAGHDGTYTKPIPVGMWIQTYKADGYVLSESELAVQYNAALAYGYKSLYAFTYGTIDPNNDVASVFFDGPNGTNPTPLYYSAARLNRQTLNLAPALLRLKSENVLFVPGKHEEKIFNWLRGWENVAVENNMPAYTRRWADSDDPYMTAINVTNVSSPGGSFKNAGLAGDVIVGYFKPLHEGFDGLDFSEQLYFMITNGLTDPNGDSSDTRQRVRLHFDFGSTGMDSLLRLDRDTGEVVETALIHDGGSLYHLDWFLLGGEGDLFKYNTGAAFVIPEPATAMMMALIGLALLRRRRA